MTHDTPTLNCGEPPKEQTIVYVGHPHGQTERYLEVIAAHQPPRTIVVFHVMDLTDQFRYLLHEGESP
ncbi:hypothetical protein ACWG8W_17045 [Citricoccus zhacaiensis]